MDAPAPVPPSAPEPGPLPRRPIRKTWLVVAIPGAIILGFALLYLSVWGFTSPKHEQPAAPVAIADGRARFTQAEYAAGSGVRYRAPHDVFSVSLPGVPSVVSTSKSDHRLVVKWRERSFVEVDDRATSAPAGPSDAVEVWLHVEAQALVDAKHGVVVHEGAGTLSSGDEYRDVTFRYRAGSSSLVAANRLTVHRRRLYVVSLVDSRELPRVFARLARSFSIGPTPAEAKNATEEDRTGAFGAFNALDRVEVWTSSDGFLSVALPKSPTIRDGHDASSLWEDARSKPDGQHLVEVDVTSYADKLANTPAEINWARSYLDEVVTNRAGRLRSSRVGHLASGAVYLDFVMTYESSGVVHRRGRIIVEGYRSILLYVDDAVGDAPATFAHVAGSIHLHRN